MCDDGREVQCASHRHQIRPCSVSYNPQLDSWQHALQPDTLKCLAMFAGEQASDLVFNHLNSIGNVANFQGDAHWWYDNLRWGIEAREEECENVCA